MASNYTPNFQLNQWEAEDKVERVDFNADNAKIEAALTKLAAEQIHIHTGEYMGTGSPTNSIKFPFRPKFIWLQRAELGDQHLIVLGDTFLNFQYRNNELTSLGHADFEHVWEGNTLTLSTRYPQPQYPLQYVFNEQMRYIYLAFA